MQLIDLAHAADRHAPLDPLPDPDAARRLRLDAGVQRTQMAAAIGVADQTLERWEAGEMTPRLGVNPRRYAAVLGALQDYTAAREQMAQR